jgi:Ca2+-binding EF-hand superfamily protein
MRRSFVLFLPLLAFLASVLASSAQPPRGRRAPDKTLPAAKGKARKASPYFDADEFLRKYDKNKDGYLSRDELPERFRHNFDRLDTNKDGKLSRAELQKGMHHLLPRRRPSDVVFTLVEMSDCDECCAEELQIIYDFLRKLDTNKDGKIHADELKTAREALVKKRVDAIFKDLDTNKDGKISRKEAKGRIKRHFDELDTNKDGFIDRDELMRAAAEKPRKAGPPRTKGKTSERRRER